MKLMPQIKPIRLITQIPVISSDSEAVNSDTNTEDGSNGGNADKMLW